MDVKGQGALEYLLLIGGAVLVAAIVIALITGVPVATNPPGCEASCASATVRAGAADDTTICTGAAIPTDCIRACDWDPANMICYYPTA